MRSRLRVVWVAAMVAVAGVAECVGVEPVTRGDHRSFGIAQDFTPGGESASAAGDAALLVGDTDTSCQENPDDGANGGTICVFSDLTGVGLGKEPTVASVVVAERFHVESNGQLTGVTWWGFMVERAGENSVNDCTLDIAPSSEDNWFIRYYVDDGFGLPDTDNIVAVFNDPAGITRIDTGVDPFGLVSEMEMHFDFPEPIDVECGTLYHVEIYSNYTFNDCYFCWQSAPPGDFQSLQADFDPSVDDFPLYNLDDGLSDFDVAQCHDFTSSGAESNLPTATLQRVAVPDVETGCCTFRYVVRNNNCIGTGGEIDEFYVAFAKGDAPDGCETIADIAAPFGWQMEMCEPWSEDGRAIFRFTGAVLGEQASTFGQIKTQVNGISEVFLDANNAVPPHSIRAWASSDAVAGQACGTGSFGPLLSETGEWGLGRNGECDLEPIPAMDPTGKLALMLALSVGGMLLVIRSRSAAAA